MYRTINKGGNSYVIPSIERNINFEKGDITIPDDTLNYIIEQFTNKEEGVRNLKRCVEIIYTKLNLFRLMKEDVNIFKKDIDLKVTFPFTVTREIVDKLLKKNNNDISKYNLYI